MVEFIKEEIFKYFEKSTYIVSFILSSKLEVVRANSAFLSLFADDNSNVKPTESIFQTPLLKDILEKNESGSRIELLGIPSKSSDSILLDLEIKKWEEQGELFCHCFGVVISQEKENTEVAKYKLIAEKTTSGVIITDALGYTTWVNNGFTKITGYSLEDMLDKKPGKVLQGKKSAKQTIKRMGEAVAYGMPFEEEILNYHKDGSEVWISVICDPIRNRKGELEGYIAIQPEITLRKQKELEAIQKNHDRFKAVFDSSMNAIIIANDNMECVDVNQAACQVLGFTKEEFMGKKIQNFIHKVGDREFLEEFFREGIQQGEIEVVDKQYKKKKLRYYAVSNVLKDTHISTLLDITKQEKLKLKHSELKKNNEEKDRLFSIISHDLRSPLSRLAILLEMLQDGNISQNEFERFTSELSEDVNHNVNLLNNLLVWSNTMLEGIKVKPISFDLKLLVDEQLAMLGRYISKKEIDCKNQIALNTTVFADKNMIDIVVRNLVSNAIKFCHRNASIILTSKVHRDTITVCVTDTGIGIPKNMLENIFTINVSTQGTNNEKGNGIGLSLCKDFIERQKGKVWVESELGVGSQFYFTLPLA